MLSSGTRCIEPLQTVLGGRAHRAVSLVRNPDVAQGGTRLELVTPVGEGDAIASLMAYRSGAVWFGVVENPWPLGYTEGADRDALWHLCRVLHEEIIQSSYA